MELKTLFLVSIFAIFIVANILGVGFGFIYSQKKRQKKEEED